MTVRKEKKQTQKIQRLHDTDYINPKFIFLAYKRLFSLRLTSVHEDIPWL